MSFKTTIFLTDQSREIIDQLKTETGQPMNTLINCAIVHYGQRTKELETLLRKIIKEELGPPRR